MGNYRVSVSYNRVKSACAYVIETSGFTRASKVAPKVNSNVKKGVLEVLEVALRETKPMVSHDDIVIIEIQNKHLCEWLTGLVEYKDYVVEMDAVFDVLENMDCKYRFIYVKEPYAKDFMTRNEVEKELKGCSSLTDIMKEFEEEE